MTNINEIQTANWQISTRGFGEVEQGANDINQCITNILSTQKGSDPLRQDFGVDLLAWIDQPTNIMGPGLSKEIIEQIATYENRINLTKVTYLAPDERVIFGLTWAYRSDILAQGFNVNKTNVGNNTLYYVLTNESGFVLLDDNEVALILN